MKKLENLILDIIIPTIILIAIGGVFYTIYINFENRMELQKEYIEQSNDRDCMSYKELEKINTNQNKCKKLMDINPLLNTNYYREMEYFFRKQPQLDTLIIKYNKEEEICYYAEAENSNTIFKIDFGKELISNLNQCLVNGFEEYEKNKFNTEILQKKFNESITIQ